MSNLKIWLVNPFDPLPGESFREGRYATLSRMLIKNGHQITWWTSDFFHVTKSYRNEKIEYLNGLEIKYIHTPRYRRNVGFGRIINHWFYAKRFIDVAKRSRILPDIIYASYPPIKSASDTIKFAHLYNIKCIIDVQDLWAEAFYDILPQPVSRSLLYPLKSYTENIFQNADGVIAVSQDFLDRVNEVRLNRDNECVIHLGVDLLLFDYLTSKNEELYPKRENDFWVTYIGIGGRSYDIDKVLEAAKLLRENEDIKFIFAGSGFMEKVIKNRGLKNCHFLGLLKYEKLVYLLKKSDVGLNPLRKKANNAFPNKIFDYMAAGLPIINSKKGELERIINEYYIGLQYESENPQSLKERIYWIYINKEKRKIMGKNSRRLAEEMFDRNKQYPRIADFIKKVAEG